MNNYRKPVRPSSLRRVATALKDAKAVVEAFAKLAASLGKAVQSVILSLSLIMTAASVDTLHPASSIDRTAAVLARVRT